MLQSFHYRWPPGTWSWFLGCPTHVELIRLRWWKVWSRTSSSDRRQFPAELSKIPMSIFETRSWLQCSYIQAVAYPWLWFAFLLLFLQWWQSHFYFLLDWHLPAPKWLLALFRLVANFELIRPLFLIIVVFTKPLQIFQSTNHFWK